MWKIITHQPKSRISVLLRVEKDKCEESQDSLNKEEQILDL